VTFVSLWSILTTKDTKIRKTFARRPTRVSFAYAGRTITFVFSGVRE
jgi:hypothetical protein